jgi:hypothetical protein
MGLMANIFVAAFYGVMLLSLLYFIHKVMWFMRFRQLQAQLASNALAKLTGRAETSLVRFEQGADVSWSEVAQGRDRSPIAYVKRIEARLQAMMDELTASRRERVDDFVASLDENLRSPAERHVCVLEVPRVAGAPREVRIDLDFPPVVIVGQPDATLFKLEVRSRYGVAPRLFAFVLGAADVVYGSRHVMRISQNASVPFAVLMRRLGLVAIVLLALVGDFAFSVRLHLVEWAEREVARGLRVPLTGDFGRWLNDHLATALGLSLWLLLYGAFYLTIYLVLFVRSHRNLRELRAMELDLPRVTLDIEARHRNQLVAWAREYGGSLDEATRVASKQVLMLLQRSVHRLRRRIANRALLEQSDRMAAAFFSRLPESSKGLRDVATEQRHTRLHYLWPRIGEMQYHVQLAQYREAFQQLELGGQRLRGRRPDPVEAEETWRNLVRLARMFPEVVPADVLEDLGTAHDRMLEAVVAETERDLEELDRRLDDLAHGLSETLASVTPVVESMVDLTSEAIREEMSEYTSEILRVRELARVEAMAFEI